MIWLILQSQDPSGSGQVSFKEHSTGLFIVSFSISNKKEKGYSTA